MRLKILAIVPFLLSACAHTEVHLFEQGLTAKETKEVVRSLQRQGFKVHRNRLDPPELDGPTVIYSPGHRDTDEITALLTALSAAGFPGVDLQTVARGNHAFTGNHVGVYLGQAVVIPEEDTGSPIAQEYSGVCQSVDAYLTLEVDGEFQLEVVQWDKNGTTSFSTGWWTRLESHLRLNLNDRNVDYQLSEYQAENQYGIYSGYRLSRNGPEDKDLFDCDFVYTEFQNH